MIWELDELDLCRNLHPVCPYCGTVDYDAWEWGTEDTHEVECGRCAKTYLAVREVEVKWTTRKPDKQTGPTEQEVAELTSMGLLTPEGFLSDKGAALSIKPTLEDTP